MPIERPYYNQNALRSQITSRDRPAPPSEQIRTNLFTTEQLDTLFSIDSERNLQIIRASEQADSVFRSTQETEAEDLTEPETSIDWRTITATSPNTEDFLRDLRVRYRNTFGLLNDGTVFFCIDFVKLNKAILIDYVIMSSPSSCVKVSKPYSPNCFTFLIPNLGARNFEDTAYFFLRRHKKPGESRYRRGFRFDNIISLPVSAKELSSINKKYSLYDQHDGFINVENIGRPNTDSILISYMLAFKEICAIPNYPTYPLAISSILTYKRLSIAVNSKYIIKLDSSLNAIILIRNNLKLAVFNTTDKFWYTITDFFNDELDALAIPHRRYNV